MSISSSLRRRLDPDAVLRAAKRAPAVRAADELRRDRRNIRRALRALGYHASYVEGETARLSAMQPRYRRAALLKLRQKCGLAKVA